MQEKHATKTIFSFFGPPGSGKGTLAEMCVRQLGFKMLSTGNLCRKHVSLGTEFGKLIDKYLQEGSLIPDELITDMVGDWLESKIALQASIILDGYPRTKGQAEYFLKFFKNLGTDYDFRVIHFIIPQEEIIKRLTNRFVCENKDCQVVYPPFAHAVEKGICDYCGGKLTKRLDDRLEIVKERLRKYSRYSKELLDFYESTGILVQELIVENKLIGQVFDDFKSILTESAGEGLFE